MSKALPSSEAPADSKAGDILTAAERLFCRNGYDGVSINDVAREAGVCKANVFHHFGSKEELYLAVLRHVRAELSRELITIARTPAGIEQSLTQIAQAYLGHLLAQPERIRLFMREILEARPERQRALAEKVLGQNYAEMNRLIVEAQGRGELRSDVSPNMPVLLLIGACIFFFQSQNILRHLPGADASLFQPDYFTGELVRVLLHGIVDREQQ